jgi:hypothetical protein
MKKLLSLLLFLLGLALLTAGCARPAQFEVSDLTILPPEVMAGGAVKVTVEVANTGDSAGSHPLTLRLNGEAVETREVSLEAGGTEQVAFSLTPQEQGAYQVEVGGLTGSFTVTLSAVEVIARASQQMAGVSSFHFVLEHEGAGTLLAAGLEMQQAVGDVARPDRLRATINGTALGMQVQVEVVLIGDTVYMTNPLPPGNWQSSPTGLSPVGFFDPQTGVAALLKEVAGLTPLGEAEVDGVPAYHLSGKVPTSALESITGSSLTGAEVEVELWVGKEDLYLLQAKITGQITPTEGTGMVRWLRFSQFNREISIEPPL